MLRPSAAKAAAVLVALAANPVPHVDAVELIPKLSCALTKTTHVGADYCLEVFNTCNTPIVSRIQDQTGTQTDSADIPPGERGTTCSAAPLTLLGHYITGPGSY